MTTRFQSVITWSFTVIFAVLIFVMYLTKDCQSPAMVAQGGGVVRKGNKQEGLDQSAYGRQERKEESSDDSEKPPSLLSFQTDMEANTDVDIVLKDFGERKSAVHLRCSQWGGKRLSLDEVVTLIKKTKFPDIIVNDQYKLLYCKINKCSTTNLSRFFYGLASKSPAVDLSSVRRARYRKDTTLIYLSDLPAPEVRRRLLTYSKLMAVRDPLERVLSHYRTKHAQNATTDLFTTGTFAEFIDDILAHPDTDNPHVHHYNRRCLPCSIEYDFIAHVNSISREIGAVKQLLRIDTNYSLPSRQDTGYSPQSSDAVLKNYLQTLTLEQMDSFWKSYQDDYFLFGYTHPKQLLETL